MATRSMSIYLLKQGCAVAAPSRDSSYAGVLRAADLGSVGHAVAYLRPDSLLSAWTPAPSGRRSEGTGLARWKQLSH
jgi:hypothetical protein